MNFALSTYSNFVNSKQLEIIELMYYNFKSDVVDNKLNFYKRLMTEEQLSLLSNLVNNLRCLDDSTLLTNLSEEELDVFDQFIRFQSVESIVGRPVSGIAHRFLLSYSTRVKIDETDLRLILKHLFAKSFLLTTSTKEIYNEIEDTLEDSTDEEFFTYAFETDFISKRFIQGPFILDKRLNNLTSKLAPHRSSFLKMIAYLQLEKSRSYTKMYDCLNTLNESENLSLSKDELHLLTEYYATMFYLTDYSDTLHSYDDFANSTYSKLKDYLEYFSSEGDKLPDLLKSSKSLIHTYNDVDKVSYTRLAKLALIELDYHTDISSTIHRSDAIQKAVNSEAIDIAKKFLENKISNLMMYSMTASSIYKYYLKYCKAMSTQCRLERGEFIELMIKTSGMSIQNRRFKMTSNYENAARLEPVTSHHSNSLVYRYLLSSFSDALSACNYEIINASKEFLDILDNLRERK